MLSQELILNFKKYCDQYGWSFDNNSSEFTFQFRLGWFINSLFKDQYIVDFETNVRKLGILGTHKKEIDIYMYDRQKKTSSAIELKFIKDRIGYDISLFKMCEDIKFLEQLQDNYHFSSTYSLAFTSIENVYTPSKNGKYKAVGERL